MAPNAGGGIGSLGIDTMHELGVGNFNGLLAEYGREKNMAHRFPYPSLLEVLSFELRLKEIPDLPKLCLTLSFPAISAFSRIVILI